MTRPELACRLASGAAEAALHHRIRHEVFVTEQRIFTGSDVDDHDTDPATVKVLGWSGNTPAGTVRLYPLPDTDGLWQGDRLAVLPPFRASALGRRLVRFAVGWAGAAGGREMVAHIQLANVAFFERLGWVLRGGPEIYVGLPHQVMAIDLADMGSPVLDLTDSKIQAL